MAKGLTPKRVIDMMTFEGKTQNEIAVEFGVSRQYIHKLAIQGGYESSTTKVTESLPWEVDSSFIKNYVYRMVRVYGRERIEGYDALGNFAQRLYRNLVKTLTRHNVVVDYNPEYGPIIGVTDIGGFAYLPRTEKDEDFIFKVREGVRITELGEKIWRLPND